jgi:hypothetical protein
MSYNPSYIQKLPDNPKLGDYFNCYNPGYYSMAVLPEPNFRILPLNKNVPLVVDVNKYYCLCYFGNNIWQIM